MIGVLLMNIGTPSGYDVPSVRGYLAEFLTDPDVIQAPAWIRHILFRYWIVPRRAPQSAVKYKQIWMKEGSPLMVYSQQFAKKLQQELGASYQVEIGMRYGTPSIVEAVEKLQSARKIILIPLYPQYAQATTASSLKKVYSVLKKKKYSGEIQEMKDFFNEPFFIQSYVERIKTDYKDKPIEHWVFSFHGLPISQIKKMPDCYVTERCCSSAIKEGRRCYRAQSLATAVELAKALNIGPENWTASFQSRVGPFPWLGPSTVETLSTLAQRGIKRIAVIAPSFVVDGLETLEEIAIEGKKHFQSHGGEELLYIPALNADQRWVNGWVKNILSQ